MSDIEVSEIRFAESRGGARIAYQVVGSGDVPIVSIPPMAQNIEMCWGWPDIRTMLEGRIRPGRVPGVGLDRAGPDPSLGIVEELLDLGETRLGPLRVAERDENGAPHPPVLVLEQPEDRLQALGLPHVDDATPGVFELIAARGVGNGAGFGALDHATEPIARV